MNWFPLLNIQYRQWNFCVCLWSMYCPPHLFTKRPSFRQGSNWIFPSSLRNVCVLSGTRASNRTLHQLNLNQKYDIESAIKLFSSVNEMIKMQLLPHLLFHSMFNVFFLSFSIAGILSKLYSNSGPAIARQTNGMWYQFVSSDVPRVRDQQHLLTRDWEIGTSGVPVWSAAQFNGCVCW